MNLTSDEARSLRLRYWNRLFRGLGASIEELDDGLRMWAQRATTEDRRAFILLRACVGLFVSSRWAVRHALRIAILYWFSHLGGEGEQPRRVLARSSAFHLSDALGAKLTWDEAVASMRRKPVDFSAYLWILEYVEAAYQRHWEEVFGRPPTGENEAMIGEGEEKLVPLV
jgi:hypothetical protein